MTIPNTQIVDACMPLLESVADHRQQERRFLTAYQIWLLLLQNNHPICQMLRDHYGNAVGRYGGEHVGPAQRIAQALGKSAQIETRYFDTRKVLFRDSGGDSFEPSGSDCGLFRLRP